MATLMSSATGNWTSSGSWSLCSNAAELDSESGTTNISTGNSDSATFQPGAVTVDGVAIKVSSLITPTGTITVTLRNSTAGSDVTSTTINASDLPSFGWVFFKFGSSQLLLAATNYIVRVNRSVADAASNRISLYRNATTANHTRQLRTTTNQAPAAGDKLFVIGEHTGGGTGNDITITYNETASTDYGTSDTTLPSLLIGKRGTLTSGVAAATNYVLRLSGLLHVHESGTLNIGTSGARIPSDSTFTLTFDSVSGGDFGYRWFAGSTINIYGPVKSVVQTLLNTDEAVSATVLGVVSTSGWENGDEIAIASTTRTAAECEKRTISTVDSSTQVTVSVGLTNAHSGTSPTQAEVINLTRRVKFQGASSTATAFGVVDTSAIVNEEYVEYRMFGINTSGKRGIQLGTTTGTYNSVGVSIHDNTVAGSRGYDITSTSGLGITIDKYVSYNIASEHIVNVAGTGVQTLTNICCIRSTSTTARIVSFSNNNITINGLVAVGSAITNNTCMALQHGTVGSIFSGNIQNITIHSNNSYGLGVNDVAINQGTIANITAWRNGQAGLRLDSNGTQAPAALVITNVTLFGNATVNLAISGRSTINNLVANGDTTFATTSGIALLAVDIRAELFLNNADLGSVSGVFTSHTQDFNVAAGGLMRVTANNCKFASSTEATIATNAADDGFIRSQNHDQTAGVFKNYYSQGRIETDAAIFFNVTPSVRLVPASSTRKLEYTVLTAAVASGQAATVSLRVRESVSGDGTDYNGNRVRLRVRANYSAGITSETTLATATVASEGAWETITGTTATVSSDCKLEFFIDCDGTTGWINVDDVVPPAPALTTGFQYGLNGEVGGFGENQVLMHRGFRTGGVL